MKFISLVKHDVVIHNSRMGDQELVIPSSGEARLSSNMIRLEEALDEATGVRVPLITFDNDKVDGLPDPKDGVIYIVSKHVREAHPHRYDLASPDGTSYEAVYAFGKLKSVPGLVVNARRGK